jgi:choline dehydrogenase-like flavoprotein
VSVPLDADVVIIGSGVAGSLIAWRLAEAKLKILILKTGPRIDCVEAFTVSRIFRGMYTRGVGG